MNCRCVDDLYPNEMKMVAVRALYDKNGRTVKEICGSLFIDDKLINRWLHDYRRMKIDEGLIYIILCEIEETEPERYKRALERVSREKE